MQDALSPGVHMELRPPASPSYSSATWRNLAANSRMRPEVRNACADSSKCANTARVEMNSAACAGVGPPAAAAAGWGTSGGGGAGAGGCGGGGAGAGGLGKLSGAGHEACEGSGGG
jgi:hypothetical protein